jgi:putative endonuclease
MTNRGKLAEDHANSWLRKNKLIILTRNFHSRWGEIDFIALDKTTICFIEVRYRKSSSYGTAAESVTSRKQQRIIKTAQVYLHQNMEHINKSARFDVISMSGDLDNPKIDWQKNAFMMST